MSLHKPGPRLTGLALLLVGMAISADSVAKQRTLGWLEWGWLEPGHIKLKTKLDTGAKTSSIHAEAIVPFERDGEPWVRFTIPLEKRPDDSDHGEDVVLERPVVREVRIKTHRKASSERYVVNIDLCIGSRSFTTPASLADRSRFNYPLLLGRTALANRVVVDPARVFTSSNSCKAKRSAP